MDDLQVDVRKLHLFNGLAKEGSATVADHLTQMSGIETGAAISKLNFLNYEDVHTHLRTKASAEANIGIYTELEDAPYGYLLFLVSQSESQKLANALLGKGLRASERDGFTDMQKSAIQELGNIMTSSFIDGWANVLGTSIKHSPPNFAYGDSAAILDQITDWPETDIVFVIDSEICAEDVDLTLTVYTFPELEPLVDVINDIDVAAISEGSNRITGLDDLS
jgi:chemotaxis protein CheC